MGRPSPVHAWADPIRKRSISFRSTIQLAADNPYTTRSWLNSLVCAPVTQAIGPSSPLEEAAGTWGCPLVFAVRSEWSILRRASDSGGFRARRGGCCTRRVLGSNYVGSGECFAFPGEVWGSASYAPAPRVPVRTQIERTQRSAFSPTPSMLQTHGFRLNRLVFDTLAVDCDRHGKTPGFG